MRLALIALLLLLSQAPANAQVETREGIVLQNQIYQLRQELNALRDQAPRQGAAPQPPRQPSYAPPPGGDLLAQLLGRVDTLEEQVRQLRGRIDEVQNQLQQATQDLNKKLDDQAFQASQPATPPAKPTTPPPAPLAKPGPRTPEVAMQEGNAALARRDYTAAEAAAREVLANRTSPRGYDAKLLLAQALQGQKQYPQAAVAFDDAYNLNRKGTHAQDSLLGLANALAAIKENKAACDTLARLRADFPQPRAEIKDGIAATAQKAACR
jgi:tetratricopeptide (TPR) repeat protein